MSDKQRREILEQLAREGLPKDIDIWATVEAQLPNQPRKIKTALAAALAVIVLAAFVTLPPLQAAAQAILAQIGHVLLTDEPTRQELQRDGLYTPAPTAMPDQGEALRILTYEELDTLLNFPIYTAAYIPEGYEYYGYMGNFFGEEPRIARAIYGGPPIEGGRADSLYITQQPLDSAAPVEFAVGEATIEDVTINGVPGVLVDEALAGSQYDSANERTDYVIRYLYWEQDGYLFSMQSRALLSTEMLRIAESLSPQP